MITRHPRFPSSGHGKSDTEVPRGNFAVLALLLADRVTDGVARPSDGRRDGGSEGLGGWGRHCRTQESIRLQFSPLLIPVAPQGAGQEPRVGSGGWGWNPKLSGHRRGLILGAPS